jgi:hypothetical protein
MHRSVVIIPTLALLAGVVSAWLPKEHNLAAFKGINKIRGVNFGGMSVFIYYLFTGLLEYYMF